jgi:hypothetical protein
LLDDGHAHTGTRKVQRGRRAGRTAAGNENLYFLK